MSDERNTLKSKFNEANRFANFGPVLSKVTIKGFRCHTNTVIEVNSPITAFCGLNGTGKSTILQLLAVARRNSYYIKNFFPSGRLDPNPYRQDASVIYQFWQENRTFQHTTISKSLRSPRWYGYKRRPVGNVFFAGIGLYVPKFEQRDLVSRHYASLDVVSTGAVEPRVREWVCKILGQDYSSIDSNSVRHDGHDGKVLTVTRNGAAYSEIHMGFGEGRSQYLVSAIEQLPAKSLVLLEEPETSLHPAAQYEFGRYLVNVACQKGHQVFLTTHSEPLLGALPDESRVYLHRQGADIKPIYGMSARQAQSMMTLGAQKALSVLVEDDVAKSVLSEIIRGIEPTLLGSLNIAVCGSTVDIAKTMNGIKNTVLKVAAVRDGDKGGNHPENIFKLPGTRPPEVEIFESAQVRTHVSATYGVDISDFRAGLGSINHHELFSQLAERCQIHEPALVSECARQYTSSVPESERRTLVDLLKEAMR